MNLTYTARKMLRVMDELGAHDKESARTAYALCPVTGQTSDGAHATLRLLFRRELTDRERTSKDNGYIWAYWLTAKGETAARENQDGSGQNQHEHVQLRANPAGETCPA
jgi:hypothetical protein